MSESHATDKLKDLGLKFDPEAISFVSEVIAETKRYLSDAETKTLEPIILAKAADEALMDGRDDIHKPDVGRMHILCAIEHLTCMRSSILHNKKVTSSVVNATDAATLEEIGIDNIRKLSNTPTHEIVDRIVTHVKTSIPSINVETSNVERLSKRVEVWKLQADLLSQID
jgi:hypothetical protein